MKVPLPWLEEYVDLKAPPRRLVEELAMKGLEVEWQEEDSLSPLLDIAVPPNRGDLLSVAGIAREMRVLGIGHGKRTQPKPPRPVGRLAPRSLRVRVGAPRACPLYSARVIRGVKVRPSPDWLVKKLEAVGIRSVNAVVDATNYVMLDRGQPLHAFDLDRLEGRRIHVRMARDKETIKTLDGSELSLGGSDLVIADAVRPIALAGIIGGMGSGISTTTEAVVLESAWFEPIGIRRTRRRLGVSTESSIRFERGVDPTGVVPALDEVTRLIATLSGGDRVEEIVSVGGVGQPTVIDFHVADLERLMGVPLPRSVFDRLLARLELKGKRCAQGRLRLLIPRHRQDLEVWQDVAEEVVRLSGLEKIPELFPPLGQPVPGVPASVRWLQGVKDLLRAVGFTEVMTYNFGSERDLQFTNLEGSGRQPLEIVNPMSHQERFLKGSLLGGLLEIVAFNEANQSRNLKIFEIGQVYQNFQGSVGVKEGRQLMGVLAGARDTAGLASKPVSYDFFELKGIVEKLLEHVGLEGGYRFRGSVPTPGVDLDHSASLLLGETTIGWLGRLAEDVVKSFEATPPLLAFEIDLDALETHARQAKAGSDHYFHPMARHPTSHRDLAVAVVRECPADDVLRVIASSDSVVAVEIFDCYVGPPLEEGQKSLAFHIRYGVLEATLTDGEVDSLHAAVVSKLEREFGAKLR